MNLTQEIQRLAKRINHLKMHHELIRERNPEQAKVVLIEVSRLEEKREGLLEEHFPVPSDQTESD